MLLHVLVVATVISAAAQATFTLPDPYSAPEQEPGAEEPAEQKPTELIYAGEPMRVPLQCRPQDFLRAGVVCGEHSPCDVLLELIDLAQIGDTIIVVGNLHTTSATIASLLLRSDDGGVTWREPQERIGAASLESIHFLDSQHGWVPGQQGEQDQSATPFVLATTDGGASWDQRRIWGGDEDRSGAVVDIDFESPQHGFLVVERLAADGDPYELYESMNGGLSWSIRQISSDKPHLKKTLRDPKPPDYRLRADTGSGIYEIERNEGGAWSRAARFALQLGSCSSMEAEIPFHVDAEP